MTSKNKKLWITSGIGIALVIGILVLANVLASFVHYRLDFSRGSVYSLSPASRRLVSGLGDPLLVNVYYSKELPPQVAVTKNYLIDLLREYVSSSHGKVRLRMTEIGDDPSSRDEAMRAGISPVQFDILSKDKYEQREGFLGLTMQYEDKKDVIPYLEGTVSLEYDLTSRIKALSSKTKPVIGFVSGYQATTQERLDPGVLEKLQTRFDLRDIDLSDKKGIPPDVKTLFLIGPQAKVPEKDIAALDNFLKSGGSLGIAVDGRRVMASSYIAMDFDAGLGDFLKSKGITLQPTLVFDRQSVPIQVQRQEGAFLITNVVQYPPILLVKDLDDAQPITQRLEGLILPFASPLQVSGPATVLARSSKYSWAKAPNDAHFISLDPFKFAEKGAKDINGPFPLAAALQQGNSRLVVIGTSKFIGGGEFKAPDANLGFFLNTVDWLSQDVDLIAIRSKSVSFHPLKEIPASAKALIRYADFFAPPLLAILAGLLVWKRRNAYRRRAREEFGAMDATATAA